MNRINCSNERPDPKNEVWKEENLRLVRVAGRRHKTQVIGIRPNSQPRRIGWSFDFYSCASRFVERKMAIPLVSVVERLACCLLTPKPRIKNLDARPCRSIALRANVRASGGVNSERAQTFHHMPCLSRRNNSPSEESSSTANVLGSGMTVAVMLKLLPDWPKA